MVGTTSQWCYWCFRRYAELPTKVNFTAVFGIFTKGMHVRAASSYNTSLPSSSEGLTLVKDQACRYIGAEGACVTAYLRPDMQRIVDMHAVQCPVRLIIPLDHSNRKSICKLHHEKEEKC